MQANTTAAPERFAAPGLFNNVTQRSWPVCAVQLGPKSAFQAGDVARLKRIAYRHRGQVLRDAVERQPQRHLLQVSRPVDRAAGDPDQERGVHQGRSAAAVQPPPRQAPAPGDVLRQLGRHVPVPDDPDRPEGPQVHADHQAFGHSCSGRKDVPVLPHHKATNRELADHRQSRSGSPTRPAGVR